MSYDWNGHELFAGLVGVTFAEVVVSDDKSCINLTAADGTQYTMQHEQDCCEHVYVESITGDIADIVGSPVLQAEVVESKDEPALSGYEDSYTWTFYKLATIKGSITIRWYGSSNGYYGESVTFAQVSA